MIKRLLFLILLCASVTSAQQHQFPATDTNNVFTGTNTFNNSTFTHLVEYTVSNLPILGTVMPGLIVVVTDGLTSADCVSGGGTTHALCQLNGAIWVPLSGSGGGGSGGPPFVGPNPWYDITNPAYGARAVNVDDQTAACNGTTTITVSDSSEYVAPDGMVFFGCGPSVVTATPSAPTITIGQSQTPNIPDSVLTATSGSTGYWYRLVGREKNGGLTPAGAITHITNGLASLGAQVFAVTSTSLSGSTLTVTASSATGIQVGDLVQVGGTTDGSATQWGTVNTISSPSFTLAGLPISALTAIPSTGGEMAYMNGQRIDFSPDSNAWQYYVCKSTDGTTYHVVGVTYPVTAANYLTSQEWTDWGSTISAPPLLPPYITDSICTGSGTPNQLITRISAIHGNTLTVEDAASQTASGVIARFTNGPAFIAAMNAAGENKSAVIYIPVGPENTGYIINNIVDLTPSVNVSLVDQAIIVDSETFIPPRSFIGVGTVSQDSFQQTSKPIYFCNGGVPCLYTPAALAPYISNISLEMLQNGNQMVGWLFDLGGQGGLIDGLDVDTGTASDYAGICWTVRSAFYMQLNNSNCNSLQLARFSTWAPNIYWQRSPGGTTSVGLQMTHDSDSGRGMYQALIGSGPALNAADGLYNQGNTMPEFIIQNFASSVAYGLNISDWTQDTSPEPFIVSLAIPGASIALNLHASNLTGSQDNGGVTPIISGVAPAIIMMDTPVTPVGRQLPVATSVYVNSVMSGSLHYYANDATDANNFNSVRGIFQTTLPITSSSEFGVPMDTPVMAPTVVSSGGSVPPSSYVFCVMAVDGKGAWSQGSCQPASVTSGNQTVALTWSGVLGAVGYTIYANQGGGNLCVTSGCAVTTTATTFTVSSIPGCCGAVFPPQVSAAIKQGIGPNGFWGSQFNFYSEVLSGVVSAPGLTGARSWFLPDKTGTFALLSDVTNPSQINLLEGSAPSGISGTDVLYGVLSNHWPAFNPNNAGPRAMCGSTGTFTSGHIVAANSSGTICDLVDGGTGTGSGTVTAVSASAITTATQNFATVTVTNPGTTPNIPYILANSPAHKYFGNDSGSTAAPDYEAIVAADLPATTVNAVSNDTNITGSISGQTLTFAWASFLSAARGGTGTTTNLAHGVLLGEGTSAVVSKVPTGNSQCFMSAASSGTTTDPAFGACPSGVTLQTNTVNNSSQTLLNFLNTTGASGITPSNSGGTESFSLASVAGGGNSTLQGTLTGPAPGDIICESASTILVNCKPGTVPNTQTGTTYAVATSDKNGIIICNETSAALAISLGSAASFGNNFGFAVLNLGTFPCTITPATSTINGTTTWTFLPGQQGNIVSDNTNYFATRSGYSSGVTSSLGGGALLAGACSGTTVTLNGAATGMKTVATPTTYPGDGSNWLSYVSGANTVTVKVCAIVALTPSASVYNVQVSQ